jgi:hypothetical protein
MNNCKNTNIEFDSYIPKIAYWYVGGINERNGYDGHIDTKEAYDYYISRHFSDSEYDGFSVREMNLLLACIEIMREVKESWCSRHSKRRILRDEWEQMMVDAGVPTL